MDWGSYQKVREGSIASKRHQRIGPALRGEIPEGGYHFRSFAETTSVRGERKFSD